MGCTRMREKPSPEGAAGSATPAPSGPDPRSELLPRARRIAVGFRVHFSGKQTQGTGVVHNISTTGALVEEASALLLAGGELRLTFSFFPDSLPVEVKAKIARETARGFGVRFVEMTPRVRELLRAAIARAERIEAGDDAPTLTLLERRSG